jgi:hypothetical protein
MWIDIKDKLHDLKEFKDGDLINNRYEEVIKYFYAYEEEQMYGLKYYKESEPVLVKFKSYYLDEDKFQIGIGVLINFQNCSTLQDAKDENGIKIGVKISQTSPTNGFMIYSSLWPEGNFSRIDEEDIEEEETRVFEWMHLPKI